MAYYRKMLLSASAPLGSDARSLKLWGAHPMKRLSDYRPSVVPSFNQTSFGASSRYGSSLALIRPKGVCLKDKDVSTR